MSTTDLIGVPEAARISGYAVDAITRACRLGQIKGAKRFGNYWAFTRAALDEWMRERRPYRRSRPRKSK
jgi:hypothetical protein